MKRKGKENVRFIQILVIKPFGLCQEKIPISAIGRSLKQDSQLFLNLIGSCSRLWLYLMTQRKQMYAERDLYSEPTAVEQVVQHVVDQVGF